VKPGNVERAIKELLRNKNVQSAEPLFGRFDLAVTGAFRDFEALQRFSEELRSKDYCESCATHPTFDLWKREERPERPWNPWTLVRAQNPQNVKTKMRQIEAVSRIYATAGENDLVVRLSADSPEELHEAILSQVQRVPGVRRTETLAAPRTEA